MTAKPATHVIRSCCHSNAINSLPRTRNTLCTHTWPNSTALMIQTFLGYKLFRVSLFLAGFLAAGLGVFYPAWQNISDANGIWYALALGGMAGLLVGGVGAWQPRIGVFLVGAALGVVIAFALNAAVLYKLSLGNPLIPLIVAAIVLGLGLGGLATIMMRTVVIVSTSVVGAYAAIRGVGHYAGNFPDEFELAKQIEEGNGSLSPVVYGYLAGIAVLAAIGVGVQFFVTARKASTDEKDEWELEYEQAELTLEALRGACTRHAVAGMCCAYTRLRCNTVTRIAAYCSFAISYRRREEVEKEVKVIQRA